jgi:tetratricopeptide (TPR) repeat protein
VDNAMLTRPPEMAWDLTLEPTESIIEKLARLGRTTDRDAVRRAAHRAGSPPALADLWLSEIEMPESGPEQPEGTRPGAGIEALLTAAAFEIWRRWMPDLTCADILAEDFDRNYEPLDILMFGNPGRVREALARAHRIAGAVAPPDGPVDRDLFEQIWSKTYHDLALWLRCLPQVLAHRELLDEAVDLCERLAPIFDARAFLADRALLLARSGRVEEARAQVAANVRAWRRDPNVLRKSCETLWALGDAEDALLLYDDVLEALSRTSSARPGAGSPAPHEPEEM